MSKEQLARAAKLYTKTREIFREHAGMISCTNGNVQCSHERFFAAFDKSDVTFASRPSASCPWQAEVVVDELTFFAVLEASDIRWLVAQKLYTAAELKQALPPPMLTIEAALSGG